MARDGTGFGFFAFGHFPFGKSDFGEDVVVRSFDQDELYDQDTGRRNELLAHYLFTIRDSVNRVKNHIDSLPDQVDFDRIRTDLMKFLGTTINVVVDDSEPADFQRSLVGNAVEYYRIKGTLKSYQIRGKISGFDVSINTLYRIAPVIIHLFPPDNVFELPLGSGVFYTDLEPGSVSGLPDDVGCDYCQTSSIKLNFAVVKAMPPAVVGEGNFFDRVAFKLKEIIPIHVRDLLFEVSVSVEVDESANMQLKKLSVEDSYRNVSVSHRFDMTTADSIALDSYCSVSGFSVV